MLFVLFTFSKMTTDCKLIASHSVRCVIGIELMLCLIALVIMFRNNIYTSEYNKINDIVFSMSIIGLCCMCVSIASYLDTLTN